jgi:putative sterol carrier protein
MLAPETEMRKALEMSDVITAAVTALNEKMGGNGFDGSAKFVIEGEGSVVVDAGGARASDEETSVTLTADAETFQAIMDGDMNPTAAFMSGKLSVDGDMGMAMQLGTVLS